MKIDLRKGRWSSESISADSIEQISGKVRLAYVDLIIDLSKNRKGDIDWWVTSLAVKNTYICPLYFRLCQLALVLEASETFTSLEVVVDSRALATIISKVTNHSVKVTVLDAKNHASYMLGFLNRYAGAVYHTIFQYIFSRLLLKKQVLPKKRVSLVDIFFTDSSVTDNRLIDRYYPGMRESLSGLENERLLYTPTHYRVRNYFSYYLRLRKHLDKLLLKEAVLSFSDYFYAIMHPFRLRWPDKTVNFMGSDVGPLVRESFLETFANSSSTEGLLRYCFAKKLRSLNFFPNRIIEWYENQEVDHGAIAGWKKFFPEVEIIGYQGFFASKHYLAMYPTKQEYEFSLLPTSIAAIGESAAKSSKEFFQELNIVNAPAFRFATDWDRNNKSRNVEVFSILVSLPIHRDDSYHIMEMVMNVIPRVNCHRRFQFFVKPHPSWGQKDIQYLSTQKMENVEFVGGSFRALLNISDVVISSASSAGVEAIACGVPTIIAGQPLRLLENSIPSNTDKQLWSICYTAEELLESLDKFLDYDFNKRQLLESAARCFRETEFNPITSLAVREFVGF